MIDVYLIVLIMFVHFIGDFMLQRHRWAAAKSKSNLALSKHVATYTITLAVFTIGFGWIGLLWAVFNGATHWAIDYITSRQTSRLYSEGKVHDFFVIIGFDQFLHHSLLVISAVWLLT